MFERKPHQQIYYGFVFHLGEVMMTFAIKLKQAWWQYQSRGWKRTSGTLITAKIDNRKVDAGYAKLERYTTNVEYQYSANGETYRAYTIIFGGEATFSTLFKAQSILDLVADDDEITVYFDPENPSRAVLIRDSATRDKTFWLSLGIALLLIAYLTRGLYL